MPRFCCFMLTGLFVLAALPGLAPTASAQRAINPVVRTFRPDPNWGGYDTRRPAGALVLVDQAITDPAAFIRGNRCIVGRWVFDRHLSDSYYGYLRYANANDDELGVRPQAGPFRVVIPSDKNIELALRPTQHADVVILREIPGTTFHELVAYNAIPEEGEVWLPRTIANTGDAFWGSAEYRHAK